MLVLAAWLLVVAILGEVLMLILLPLSVPVTTGLLLITRILYPVPAAVLDGILAFIVPTVVAV